MLVAQTVAPEAPKVFVSYLSQRCLRSSLRKIFLQDWLNTPVW
jgi:hypothetical protein